MVQNFQVTHINDTTVRVTWQRIESDGVDRYTVYYYSTSEVKRQFDSGSKNFPANVSEGVIDGLDPNLDYIFSITVTFTLGGIEYEGEETDPIIPSGNVVWMDANRYCFKLFLMNIVISTSSLDISIMMSSSSTITGINYILTTIVFKSCINYLVNLVSI